MMLTASTSAAVDAVLEHAQLAITALGQERLRLQRWGTELHDCLRAGGLVLAAGNGGSATHAEHFVGELVGRFRYERRALRAAALTTDSCALTAIANDYGYDQVFARQITALARPGDAVVLFSTSGHSPNVLAATTAARTAGARVLAVTGPAPNPLADGAHDALAVDAPDTASIQDAHHVAVHALCAAIDEGVFAATRPGDEEALS
jgi:D-sedoheptulose 7-phosphate isomerase